MRTDYYRIPAIAEMSERKRLLMEQVSELAHDSALALLHHYRIQGGRTNPWNAFIDGAIVHIGRKSSGWRFLWFHNEWEMYDGPEEMLAFIRSGRVSDGFGNVVDTEEFIRMATSGEGLTALEYYEGLDPDRQARANRSDFVDIIKDGFHYSRFL